MRAARAALAVAGSCVVLLFAAQPSQAWWYIGAGTQQCAGVANWRFDPPLTVGLANWGTATVSYGILACDQAGATVYNTAPTPTPYPWHPVPWVVSTSATFSYSGNCALATLSNSGSMGWGYSPSGVITGGGTTVALTGSWGFAPLVGQAVESHQIAPLGVSTREAGELPSADPTCISSGVGAVELSLPLYVEVG